MHFILPYFIILLILLQFAIKKGTRNHKARNEEFLERETKANQVRRKDISNLNYISIPDNLPLINSGNETFDSLITSDPRMKRAYDSLQALRGQKILNLTGISNTDLKLSYGVANLTALTEYDDNFTTLAKSIALIGHNLLEHNDIEDAAAYLEYGISVKSDISSNYIDLAIIYAANNEKDSIAALKEQALSLKSLSRDSIVTQLDAIMTK